MKQKNTKSNKIKIGVVGEHPSNDSESLCHLLRPLACENVQFKVILTKLRGSQLDNERMFLSSLESEFLSEELHHVIFIRDLDGVFSEKEKVTIRDNWSKRADKTINRQGIFFLAIAEMEALILSDIDKVNELYKLKLKAINNPMTEKDPKKKLMQLTEKTKRGKYTESDAPVIFKELVFQTVYKNHKGERSFQVFADELKDKQIIAF
ncbi:MAG: hypothetical protein U5L45_27090 [Saprospiraceae bacterium]|nr:hypothetical protein [Saprospiraceae bacterium]